MPNIELKLTLSSNRNQSGILTIIDQSTNQVLGQFEALGRGSQGGGDTQMQVNGNTPTGTYNVTRLVDTNAWNQNSYGPNGALRLSPTSGNSLAAEQQIGRQGLLVHGGSPGGNNYWRGADELRATHGCVRLSNENMENLVGILFEATLDERNQQSSNIDINLTVTDHNMSFARP